MTSGAVRIGLLGAGIRLATVSFVPLEKNAVSPKVLLADDQRDVLVALELLLKSEGFAARTTMSPDGVLDAVRNDRFDALIMDLNYTRDTTSGREGLDLLARLASIPNAPPVIVMTAWGSMELAVEAMRRGARDFVVKPWDNQALIDTLRKSIGASGATRYSRNELDVATKVQQRLWPCGARSVHSLEVAGFSRPAGAVGGDTYDFIEIGARRIAFALADVSGKGLPAALLMASLQAILQTGVRHSGGELRSFMEVSNRHFYESTELQRYATLFFAVYDEDDRALRYVSCAHPSALVIDGQGGIRRLEANTGAFGMFDQLEVSVSEHELHDGDTIVVYSDGVLEAETSSGTEAGEEALLAAWRASNGTPVAELPQVLVERLSASYPCQTDDMTIVAARVG